MKAIKVLWILLKVFVSNLCWALLAKDGKRLQASPSSTRKVDAPSENRLHENVTRIITHDTGSWKHRLARKKQSWNVVMFCAQVKTLLIVETLRRARLHKKRVIEGTHTRSLALVESAQPLMKCLRITCHIDIKCGTYLPCSMLPPKECVETSEGRLYSQPTVLYWLCLYCTCTCTVSAQWVTPCPSDRMYTSISFCDTALV